MRLPVAALALTLACSEKPATPSETTDTVRAESAGAPAGKSPPEGEPDPAARPSVGSPPTAPRPAPVDLASVIAEQATASNHPMIRGHETLLAKPLAADGIRKDRGSWLVVYDQAGFPPVRDGHFQVLALTQQRERKHYEWFRDAWWELMGRSARWRLSPKLSLQPERRAKRKPQRTDFRKWARDMLASLEASRKDDEQDMINKTSFGAPQERPRLFVAMARWALEFEDPKLANALLDEAERGNAFACKAVPSVGCDTAINLRTAMVRTLERVAYKVLTDRGTRAEALVLFARADALCRPDQLPVDKRTCTRVRDRVESLRMAVAEDRAWKEEMPDAKTLEEGGLSALPPDERLKVALRLLRERLPPNGVVPPGIHPEKTLATFDATSVPWLLQALDDGTPTRTWEETVHDAVLDEFERRAGKSFGEAADRGLDPAARRAAVKQRVEAWWAAEGSKGG